MGLILASTFATFVEEPGERQLGWGLLWLFSLPGISATSAGCAALYGAYVNIEKPARRAVLYLGLVVLVTAVGTILTLGILRVWV